MPAQVARRGPFLSLAAAVLVLGFAVLMLGFRLNAADAQTVGVQVTSFPGVTVELPARTVAVTREVVTSCPPGGYAVAGGWSLSGPGAADVRVTVTYPSRLPYGADGGAWTLAVTKPAGRPAATLTPYASCVLRVSQLPE
jgi:hypothetical protein